ncbi:hypothetical protein DFP73DRAFT_285621 [Morchella snyderi]|nr:hypothetical protein DFP73DRAFT_285621 [Morchella snyderi]
MTLGSETAAVLMRAMVTLNHQTSAAQHAQLTPDERKSVMHQLTVAFETAAKLADVAHLEAAAVVAQCNASGTGAERVETDTVGSSGDAERLVPERERAKADVGVVWGETEEQTAKGSPVVVVAGSKPLEAPGVASSSTITIQNPLGTSSPPVSPPVRVPPSVTEATIIGLYAGNRRWRRLRKTWTNGKATASRNTDSQAGFRLTTVKRRDTFS